LGAVGSNRNLNLLYYFALVVDAAGVAGATVVVAGAEPAVASVVGTTVVAVSVAGAASTAGAATTGAATGASTGFSAGEQATRAARINVSIVFTSFIKI
jgi:hypothetical protein